MKLRELSQRCSCSHRTVFGFFIFDAGGTARDGKSYANTYAWFLDLRDGKIVKAFAFFDSVVFNEFWARVKPQ